MSFGKARAISAAVNRAGRQDDSPGVIRLILLGGFCGALVAREGGVIVGAVLGLLVWIAREWRQRRRSSRELADGDELPPLAGYVYVMTNEAWPDMCKVGFTTRDPERRAADFSTGAPTPYQVYGQVRIYGASPQEVEKVFHKALGKHRVKGEWFRLEPDKAVRMILRRAGLPEDTTSGCHQAAL